MERWFGSAKLQAAVLQPAGMGWSKSRKAEESLKVLQAWPLAT